MQGDWFIQYLSIYSCRAIKAIYKKGLKYKVKQLCWQFLADKGQFIEVLFNNKDTNVIVLWMAYQRMNCRTLRYLHLWVPMTGIDISEGFFFYIEQVFNVCSRLKVPKHLRIMEKFEFSGLIFTFTFLKYSILSIRVQRIWLFLEKEEYRPFDGRKIEI